MKKVFIIFSILTIILTAQVSSHGQTGSKILNTNLTDNMGVQIHFTTGHTQELDMIQKAGFKRIRMDFFWNKCETKKGIYDFSEYDKLYANLKSRGLKPIFELDFGNSLYGEPWSVKKPNTRKAFANFAANAVEHFKNEDIIWEIWNEPNISKFWYPTPNATEYTLLVKETSTAIRKKNPNAVIVGPALSEIKYNYLEDCMKNGLLNYIDAITVHPYRPTSPETLEQDIIRLKALIEKYNKEKKNIQILSGEWGYPSKTFGLNESIQSKYLTRMFLYNAYLGIPVSIWYDWQDDGVNPDDPEHNFGLTYFNGSPKPAYNSMTRITAYLKDKTKVQRLPSNSNDYILLFTGGNGEEVYAVWTTQTNHTIKLNGVKIELNDMPTFIIK